MAGVKKLVKKTLGNLNIVNQTEPTKTTQVAPASPLPTPTPPPTLVPAEEPQAIPVPKLEDPAKAPDPIAIRQIRQQKLANIAASTAGRAATILTKRRARERRETGGGFAAASGGGSPTYVNDLLGK